ncbi:hypothetical protein INR49_029989 [Caranx melampygus]|nr:hypothetical protein INR49_029989 [Caranx melampygus]
MGNSCPRHQPASSHCCLQITRLDPGLEKHCIVPQLPAWIGRLCCGRHHKTAEADAASRSVSVSLPSMVLVHHRSARPRRCIGLSRQTSHCGCGKTWWAGGWLWQRINQPQKNHIGICQCIHVNHKITLNENCNPIWAEECGIRRRTLEGERDGFFQPVALLSCYATILLCCVCCVSCRILYSSSCCIAFLPCGVGVPLPAWDWIDCLAIALPLGHTSDTTGRW